MHYAVFVYSHTYSLYVYPLVTKRVMLLCKHSEVHRYVCVCCYYTLEGQRLSVTVVSIHMTYLFTGPPSLLHN